MPSQMTLDQARKLLDTAFTEADKELWYQVKASALDAEKLAYIDQAAALAVAQQEFNILLDRFEHGEMHGI